MADYLIALGDKSTFTPNFAGMVLANQQVLDALLESSRITQWVKVAGLGKLWTE